MGIFKKIFKGLGKVFKKVGKFIKKGFGKLGKFMNKFGILGQIGMMYITGGLANMAFSGLQTLGQGFMSGLATSAAQGNAFASVAHGVLQGAAKIANIPLKAVSSITDQVVGTITDVAQAMGGAVGGTGVTAAQGVTFAPDAGAFDKIFANAAGRMKTGVKSVGAAFGDLKKFSTEVLPGGTPYNPQYREINVGTAEAPRMVEKEITYSSENLAVFEKQENLRKLAEKAFEQEEMSKAIRRSVEDVSLEDIEATPYEPGQVTLPKMDPERIQYNAETGKLDIKPDDPFGRARESFIKDSTKFQSELTPVGPPLKTDSAVKSLLGKGFDLEGATQNVITQEIYSAMSPKQQFEFTAGGGRIAQSRTYEYGTDTGSIAGLGQPIPSFGNFPLTTNIMGQQTTIAGNMDGTQWQDFFDKNLNMANFVGASQKHGFGS